jgi:hypothetical protein
VRSEAPTSRRYRRTLLRASRADLDRLLPRRLSQLTTTAAPPAAAAVPLAAAAGQAPVTVVLFSSRACAFCQRFEV